MPAKKKTAPVKLTANPRGSARVSKKPPLTPAQLKQIDAYWRASNYLTACQLYLLDNPLLERPLTAADLKQTIVGHWGTCPGQNFIYTHLDRVIKRDDLDMIYLPAPVTAATLWWCRTGWTAAIPRSIPISPGIRTA